MLGISKGTNTQSDTHTEKYLACFTDGDGLSFPGNREQDIASLLTIARVK